MNAPPLPSHAEPVARPLATSRPRALLLCYLCSPERGSEYGVGWHRAVEAARQLDTWVLIGDHPECLNDIDRYIRRHGPVPGLTFVPVPVPHRRQWLRRIPGGWYVAYRAWQRAAFQTAQRLDAELHFDLVHHVNYCGYREPGYLWKLEAPFVWGPVGGTQNYPWQFLPEAGFPGALREAARTLLNHLQLRFSPRVRRAARRAAALLAANSTIRADLQRVHGIGTLQQLETGVSSVAAAPRRPADPSRPLRLVWSGDLEPWKALSLLLRALARLPSDVPVQLRVYGRGSLLRSHQRLAQRLGVSRCVEWMGFRPHGEYLQALEWGDLLIFTSLRDTSGNVVLEALAAGMPVVCLDHQGVRDIVTADCGVKIPVTTRSAVVRDLAAAIARLFRNPGECERLSEGALRRARQYLWSELGCGMAEVYERVLSEHPRRPTVEAEAAGSPCQSRAVAISGRLQEAPLSC